MQQPPRGNGQVTRAEYEARHAALAAQVAQNESRFFAEQATLKIDLDRKFDRLIDEIKGLRKDFVQKEVLTPQIEALERRQDNLEKRQDTMEKEQVSRIERFWMRFGPLIALGMFILTLLEIFTKGHLGP